MDITQLLSKHSTAAATTKSQNEEQSGSVLVPTRKQKSARFKVYGSHMISSLPPKSDFQEYFGQLEKGAKIKVAAFDMDDTLICSKSGVKWGRGPSDWKWRTDTIIPVLQQLVSQGKCAVAIFTNQQSISVTELLTSLSKSYRNFTIKVGQILASLDVSLKGIPILVFAAPGRPGKLQPLRSTVEEHHHTRKPGPGMWETLQEYVKAALGDDCSIDMEASFYVGDAAGRDGDHLADDLNFAKNAGLSYQIPEDFFGK